jgi:hypothetical protein
LGIKDEMTEVELELNTRYLKEEFPDFTLEKIRLAIKYSLKGELKCDIKPYGAFSPLYISTILNAYRRYDQKIVDGVLREKNRLELEEKNKPVELSQVEKVESRRLYLKWFQVQLNSIDGVLKDFNNVMWNFLTRNNVIDPKHEERIEIRGLAENELKRTKNPFELAVTTADEWDKLIRYFVMLEFRGMIHLLDIDTYTDEQIML